MKKRLTSEQSSFNPRVFAAFILCIAGVLMAMIGFAANPASGVTGLRANSPDYSYPIGNNETGPLSDNTSATSQQLRQGLYRGMPVTYVVRNGKSIFQGDIILEKVDPIDSQRPLPSSSIDSSKVDSASVAYTQYLWPKVGNQYQIPYIIASGTGNLTNLNNAIAQFNSTFSNIKFVARTTETDYVNFYFDPNDNSAQCEAIVGRAGGQQQVGGSGGSFNPCGVGTILHEMGHTVGLWHEQSRPDRNTYVSVNYGNLIKGSISNFNQIYDNMQAATLFDYASIMEYPAFAFSRNGGAAIESIPAGIPLSNLTGYTAADIDGIERLYGNPPTAVTITSNPPGLQVIVDGSTVTTPQVFSNWALNSTHTLTIPSGVQSQAGNIVNSTTSTTFYYTYGRWNDSTAASHSITIAPGNGNLATPGTSPAVTTYTANFIQLVPYAATVFPSGTGAVTPSPAPQSYPGSALVFYTARQQATLTAAPNAGQNFYEFNNAPFWLPGGLGANPKTFYVPDTGLTVNTTAEFSPNPVYTVNVAPNPFSSNLYIYVDGGFWYAPKNFSQFYDSGWTPGSMHTLSVNNPAFNPADPEYPYSSNSRYAFNNWSDGMAVSHTITLPPTSTTYTANLTPQFYVTDYVNETCAGSINITPSSPTGDGFYPGGAALTFTETPNPGWLFTGWQYDLSGTSNPKMLTVGDEVLVVADYNTIATPLTLTSLSPASVFSGNPTFILTLNGTGFTPSSVVSVNGGFPTVNFTSSTQLSVSVTAAQVAQPGAFQVWVENFPSGATCAAFAALPFTVANRLTSVVSRKMHSGAGTFDLTLNSGTPVTIEPRAGGNPSGNHTLVFSFLNTLNTTNPVSSITATATTSGGTQNVTTAGNLGTDTHQYIVNLSTVPNASHLTVTLNSVTDSANNVGDISAHMDVLLGDVNSSARTDSGDVTAVRNKTVTIPDQQTFRFDVNTSGRIDSGDVTVTRNASVTVLP